LRWPLEGGGPAKQNSHNFSAATELAVVWNFEPPHRLIVPDFEHGVFQIQSWFSPPALRPKSSMPSVVSF
jgi:hypothetical protein